MTRPSDNPAPDNRATAAMTRVLLQHPQPYDFHLAVRALGFSYR